MKKAIYSFLFFLTATSIYSQNSKNYNIWYFGTGAGINFNTSPTTVIPKGTTFINSDAGVSTYCDANGALLLSSNGANIFNSNNATMQNGGGLNGDSTATQSCVIVPKPGSTSIFYVFTLSPFATNNGLYYSTVDLTQNGGLGSVTSRNTAAISTKISEKLTAVAVCKTGNYYVISHEVNSNRFIFIPVTAAGVGTPIYVAAGSNVANNAASARGVIKVSPDGSRLVCVQNNQSLTNTVEVFNLNIAGATPTLTNPIKLNVFGGEYGASFSSDNSRLYITSSTDLIGNLLYDNRVIQFDITASNVATSGISIQTKKYPYKQLGDLQLGFDNKIYMAQQYIDSVFVINNINDRAPIAYLNIDSGIKLISATCRLGLPNNITSAFNIPMKAYITKTLACVGSAMPFFNATVTNYSSNIWDFGDPNSGANNLSTLFTPTHIYTSPGKYTVKLTSTNNCGDQNSAIDSFVIASSLPVDLGLDSATICWGDSKTFDCKITGSTYEWFYVPNTTNTGTSQTFTAFAQGRYAVKVSNAFCSGTDTVFLKVDSIKPILAFTDSAIICHDSILVLDASNGGKNKNASYAWSKTIISTKPSIIPQKAGWYKIAINIGACSLEDSVLVSKDTLNEVIIADKNICPGYPIGITIPNTIGMTNISWSNGAKGAFVSIPDSGTYHVLINTENGCIQKDTFYVKSKCAPFLYVPTAFSPNDDSYNDTFFVANREIYDVEFVIYNRWNQVVFSTTDLSKGWDGTLNGKECESGRYFYRIYYKTDVSAAGSLTPRYQYRTQTGVQDNIWFPLPGTIDLIR